jgi:hypothetical protein
MYREDKFKINQILKKTNLTYLKKIFRRQVIVPTRTLQINYQT